MSDSLGVIDLFIFFRSEGVFIIRNLLNIKQHSDLDCSLFNKTSDSFLQVRTGLREADFNSKNGFHAGF